MGDNILTQFVDSGSSAVWEDFRNVNDGENYRLIRQLVFADQGGLCAYCETQVSELSEYKQRLEHFHPKADVSDSTKNWQLDWNNIIGVCIGGEKQDKEHKNDYPLPENLSCDSHKNHLVNKGRLSLDVEAQLLNPLQIPATPCLFSLDMRTGKLYPNEEACQQLDKSISNSVPLTEKVAETIKVLNLNCDRLNQKRLKIRNEYNRLIKKAIKEDDKQVFEKIAEQWFRNQWPAFFTTRRLLLGNHAEAYLQRINYAG